MSVDYQFNIQEGESITYYANCAHEILSRYKGKKNLMVDVGAHIGVVSVMAVLEEGFKFAIAIEPNLVNFVRLIDNIQLNGCEGRILPVWAAVGTKSFTQGTLYSNDNNGNLNSGVQSLNYQGRYPSERVCIVTLADILKNSRIIDLLKIDIEGGEWDLFTEENKEIFMKARWIDIELHHTQADFYDTRDLYAGKIHNADEAQKYLEDCGFKLIWYPEANGFYGGIYG